MCSQVTHTLFRWYLSFGAHLVTTSLCCVCSRCAYSWLQLLRHHITGERRSAGVQVSVGVDTLDYGYEYQGVATAAVPTPTTLRARYALLTAAARNKCKLINNSLPSAPSSSCSSAPSVPRSCLPSHVPLMILSILSINLLSGPPSLLSPSSPSHPYIILTGGQILIT